MSSWIPTFKPDFFKDLKKFPKEVRHRIDTAVQMVIQDPKAGSAKRLAGHSGLYRFRIGDYRMVYYVNESSHKILFLLVAHRRDVYRVLERM
jgi:mRNA interferase RelE/StbE